MRKADNLPADNLPPYSVVVKKSRSLNILDPSGPAWPVMGVLYCSKLGQHSLQFFFNYSPPVWLYSVQKVKHISVVGIAEEEKNSALS